MFRTFSFAAIVLGGVLVASPAFSQESNKQEVSVQALGGFVKSTTQNGIQQDATNSGGILANYRIFFAPNHGVEVTYGYSRNTQSYGFLTSTVGVRSDQHEFTAAYVYRHPWKSLTPFVEAGAGALVFDPANSLSGNTQARAAFVYGGGADFNITKQLFLRAQYRGFVYNSPTFELTASQGADRVTHRAEPSLGFGFRF